MIKWNEMKWITDLKGIQDTDGWKRYFHAHSGTLKKAVLPVVIVFALFFFWFSGQENEEIYLTESNPQEAEASAAEKISQETETAVSSMTETIYVDLGGEVIRPGVYPVSEGTRLFQVIELAGGLKDTADTDSINQAEAVSDGQKIIIGSKDSTSPYYTGSEKQPSSVQGGTSGAGYQKVMESAVRETENGTIVNINLADASQLQLLPGVGPSTAQKILDYRAENGNFQTIEEIKNISGIGDKTFENLKDFIEI